MIKSIIPSELRRGAVIGTGSSGVVSSIGQTKDGVEIVLKKTREVEIDGLPYQLAFIDYLYGSFTEEQKRMLPQFLGVLANKKGKAIGIIMDRFGRRNDIDSYRPNDIETVKFQEILAALGMPDIDRDHISPSLFRTEYGLRLGDLFMLTIRSIKFRGDRTPQQNQIYELAQELKNNSELYTIRADVGGI